MWNRPFLMVFFPTIFLILGRMALGCSRNASKESMMLITGCNRCTKHPRNIRSWLQEGDLLIQEHLVFLTFQILFFLSFFFFLPPFLFGEFWISDGMEDSTWFCPPGICQSLRRSWYVCTMIFEIILASMPGRWQGWQGWQLCFLPMADDFLIAFSWDIFLWLNSMVYGC